MLHYSANKTEQPSSVYYDEVNASAGNQLLPTVVQLLLHLPSPQKLAGGQHQSDYSLRLLSQDSRHLWLNSLILILYKYRFNQAPINDDVMSLINIVTKTLQAQAHVCCETDQLTDIATWEDISDEESEESPRGLIRPESLTVTTIQENGREITLHPSCLATSYAQTQRGCQTRGTTQTTKVQRSRRAATTATNV